MRKCPKCGQLNDDDWPLKIKDQICDGGCQDCWESECDKSWWKMINKINKKIKKAIIKYFKSGHTIRGTARKFHISIKLTNEIIKEFI